MTLALTEGGNILYETNSYSMGYNLVARFYFICEIRLFIHLNIN